MKDRSKQESEEKRAHKVWKARGERTSEGCGWEGEEKEKPGDVL